MSVLAILCITLFINQQVSVKTGKSALDAHVGHASAPMTRHNVASGARRCINQCYMCLNAENKSFDESQDVCSQNGYLPADDEIIYAPLLKRYCWSKGPTWTSLRFAGRGWFFVGGDGRPFSIKENTSISHFFTTSIPSEITDYKTCAILNVSEIRNHNCHSTDIHYVMCRKNCDQVQESPAEPLCFHRYVNRNLTVVSTAPRPNLVLKCVYRRSSIMCPDGHAFRELTVAELCDESLCQPTHFLASASVLLIVIGLINGILIFSGCGLFVTGAIAIIKAKSQYAEIS